MRRISNPADLLAITGIINARPGTRSPSPTPISRPVQPNRGPVPGDAGRVLAMEPEAAPVPVRNVTVVVRLVGRVAAGREEAMAAEQDEEQSLELLAEDDVDDEVDARVDGDEEVARLDHAVEQVAVHVDLEGLDDVDHQGQQVALEEDHHHAEEHRGQADLAALQPG